MYASLDEFIDDLLNENEVDSSDMREV